MGIFQVLVCCICCCGLRRFGNCLLMITFIKRSSNLRLPLEKNAWSTLVQTRQPLCVACVVDKLSHDLILKKSVSFYLFTSFEPGEVGDMVAWSCCCPARDIPVRRRPSRGRAPCVAWCSSWTRTGAVSGFSA